jgi:DNA-binding transcriptional MerR regulator
VVELIKIRTLADAGVPLARVRELLAASQEEFSAAVADIDVRLRAEIRERQRHRERIAQLAAGDSLALPPEAVAYIDRLRKLDLPELMIGGERDSWILVAAQLPEQMPLYMKLKEAQLDDPATVDLYHDLAELLSWKADDPRVAEVGDRIVAALEADEAAEAARKTKGDYASGWETLETGMSDDLVELLDSVFLKSVPIARRLMQRLEERGWRGWTRFERIDPA